MTDFRKLVLLHTKTDTAKKLVSYLYNTYHSDQEVFRCLAPGFQMKQTKNEY